MPRMFQILSHIYDFFSEYLKINDTIVIACALADLRGRMGRAPPGGPNSFNFMQFLGKFGKIVCCRPPGGLALPPRRNPGSATACVI